MIVNYWRRVLLVFELSTPRQLCFNRSPRPSEEIPGGLSHSFYVDLSNTAWAKTGLINELSENAFGTVTRIRLWKSATQPDEGFGPKNPRRSHKQDSTQKTHRQAMVLHLVPCKRLVRVTGPNCSVLFGAVTKYSIIYIYIYIYIYNHYTVILEWISLTLPRHSSQSSIPFGRFSRAVVDKFYLVVQHLLVRVKGSRGARRLTVMNKSWKQHPTKQQPLPSHL